MKRTSVFSILIAAGLLFTACRKNNNADNTTPGQPQLSVQIKTTNQSSGIAQKGTANANIQWTAGYAYPKSISFEAKQNNLQVEYKSTADQQIDLMASVATSFGNFTLPAGTYDEVELKIDLDKHAANPAMELDGTFSNNAVIIPVKVMIDDFLELKTETENVTITNNASFVAVTTLDLSTITSGISEAELLSASLTNGTLEISAHSNVLLYHTILNNLGTRRHHCEFEHHEH